MEDPNKGVELLEQPSLKWAVENDRLVNICWVAVHVVIMRSRIGWKKSGK
jgi:hypothetical protein